MNTSLFPNSGLGILTNGCSPKEYNNFMISRECHIERGICEYLKKNPSTGLWANKIITTEKFPEEEGYTLTKYIFHSSPAPQVPTNEMFKTLKGSSPGTPDLNPADPAYVEPNDACAVSCHEVSYGMEAKQWTIQQACLNTAWLCAMDIQFNYMFREVLNAQAENLARISVAIKAAWNRDKTMEFSTIIPAYPYFENLLNGPKGVLPRIPDGGICSPNFLYLEGIYDALSLQYGEHAVGTAPDGSVIFGALASRSLNYEMRASDPNYRELDKYGQPTFYKDGFKGEYIFHGFSFMTDPEAPRFEEDPLRPGYLRRVWAYEQSATTIGTRWDAKPGGAYDKAPYEGMIILFRDQFTNVPFKLNTRPGGKVAFDDTDFTGQVRWQKIADCEDEDGMKGRYRMRFIQGAKPGCHDAGLMFLFKRCQRKAILELLCGCSTSPACPVDCTPETVTPTFTCAEADGALVLTAVTGSTLTGVPEDTVPTDILYVEFANGTVLAGTVTAYTDSTPGPESVTLEIEGVTSCDYAGGVVSVSSTAPCIPVAATSVMLNGASHTAIKFKLMAPSPLFSTTPGATYTATFGDDTTATATLVAGPVLDDGDEVYVISFASNLSLVDVTTRDGLVCLRPL